MEQKKKNLTGAKKISQKDKMSSSLKKRKDKKGQRKEDVGLVGNYSNFITTEPLI